MYEYNAQDQRIVQERAQQFRGQVERRLDGSVIEDEFKPLRLQNGLYMQLHAYMLRVAIPYGLITSRQLRRLAHIARTYDRGYAHFTTRQNLQYNWPTLTDVPKILDELAEVQMHAIQTSGNCIRNVTADHLAGVAHDELEDPRPYCELIRQWSTLHPEFAFLPRKFKIAVTGAPAHDRAAIRFHDIGVRITDNAQGERGFEVWVGGGLGRTPLIGQVCRDFVAYEDLLSYLEAILRVYNRQGRRDNKYKARIKILVGAIGIDAFRGQVDAEWREIKDSVLKLDRAQIDAIVQQFAPPDYAALSDKDLSRLTLGKDRGLAHFVRNNLRPHKAPGYVAVMVSLKPKGRPPGDVSDTQLDALADIADEFSHGQITATHGQNLVLAHVRQHDVAALHAQLAQWELATPNIGHLTDSICCPGLDFCNLANARSIPLALEVAERFDEIDYLQDLGPISLKISGCINACGHHHVGDIGILGIDKLGTEAYQLLLGGSAGNDAAIGSIVGQAFASDKIVDAVQTVLDVYLAQRTSPEERFHATIRRIGNRPFKEALYGES